MPYAPAFRSSWFATQSNLLSSGPRGCGGTNGCISQARLLTIYSSQLTAETGTAGFHRTFLELRSLASKFPCQAAAPHLTKTQNILVELAAFASVALIVFPCTGVIHV